MNIKETLKKISNLQVEKDYKKELGSLCDYKDLPIAPSMIEDKKTPVILSKKAASDYEQLVEYASTDLRAIKYPFLILGKRKELDNEDIITLEKVVHCYDIHSTLSEVKIDQNKVIEAMADENYDILAWGKLHGRLTDNQRKSSPLTKLSNAFKKRYNIREEELNIPLTELDEYEAISDATSIVDNEKEVYQIIIMPTGEIAMLGIEDDKYHKFENIELYTGDDIKPVPVESFDSKFQKQSSKSKRG